MPAPNLSVKPLCASASKTPFDPPKAPAPKACDALPCLEISNCLASPLCNYPLPLLVRIHKGLID